jgi:hypothetical protein
MINSRGLAMVLLRDMLSANRTSLKGIERHVLYVPFVSASSIVSLCDTRRGFEGREPGSGVTRQPGVLRRKHITYLCIIASPQGGAQQIPERGPPSR